MTTDRLFIQPERHETLEAPRLVIQLRGRSHVTQEGEELCRVMIDLVEFERNGASTRHPHFQGTLELTGGVPLNVGLPDLVLDLPDGRRVSIEITSLTRNERREVYGVRGRVVRPTDA